MSIKISSRKKILVLVISSLLVITACKKRLFNPINKYTGTWSFTTNTISTTALSFDSTGLADSTLVETSGPIHYEGDIRYNKRDQFNFELSASNTSTYEVSEEGEISRISKDMSSGKRQSIYGKFVTTDSVYIRLGHRSSKPMSATTTITGVRVK